MILPYVKRAVLVVAAAGICSWLAEDSGTWPAILIWAGATAIACSVGAVLLRTSAVGKVTWENRLAGYLNPWGWRLNRGLLWPIPVISWAVWVTVGGAAVLIRPGAAGEAPGTGFRVALFAAWVTDGAALMYILGTILQATPGSRVGPLWKLAAAIGGLIGVSVGLYVGGLATAALIVGGGPPLVAGGCVGLVVLLLATVGRNTRWN